MKKALVIVDMQNFFLKNMQSKNKKQLIDNQIQVVNHCVKNSIPIIELEYIYPGENRGKTIKKLAEKYIPYITIQKESNGGFTNTELKNILNNLKIREIFLIGINANGCVQDTAIGAINRGLKITTGLGVIANTWSDDLGLSKNNLNWYKNNTRFFTESCELINHLN